LDWRDDWPTIGESNQHKAAPFKVKRDFMKTWLRLTLITMTVGGGFAGLALTFQALLSGITSHNQPFSNLLIMGIFLLLNAGVTVSGLLFVYDAHRYEPLIAAIAIQVPWISSSLIAYRFATGFELVLSVNGPAKGEDLAFHLGWAFFLGSSWSLSFSQEHQFGLGINVWALTMLVLLWRSVRMPAPAVQPATSTSVENNSAEVPR
jgi:hypothetical protein